LAHSFSSYWLALDGHSPDILKYHLGLAFRGDGQINRLTLMSAQIKKAILTTPVHKQAISGTDLA
jgi:hypothetical protein